MSVTDGMTEVEVFADSIDWANDLLKVLTNRIQNATEELDQREVRENAREVLQNVSSCLFRLTALQGDGSTNQHIPRLMSFEPGDFLDIKKKIAIIEQVEIAKNIVKKATEIFATNVQEDDPAEKVRVPFSVELYGKVLYVKNGDIIDIVNGKDERSINENLPSLEDCIAAAEAAKESARQGLRDLKHVTSSKINRPTTALETNMRSRSRLEKITSSLLDGMDNIAMAIGSPKGSSVLGRAVILDDPQNKGLRIDINSKLKLMEIERALTKILEDTFAFAVANTTLRTLPVDSSRLAGKFVSLNAARTTTLRSETRPF